MSASFDIPSAEYEQACLDAVRGQLGDSKVLEHDGIELKSVELVRGANCLCIVAFLVRKGRDTRVVWRLYEDAFSGIPPEGRAEPPDGVATQMWLWAMGA